MIVSTLTACEIRFDLDFKPLEDGVDKFATGYKFQISHMHCNRIIKLSVYWPDIPTPQAAPEATCDPNFFANFLPLLSSAAGSPWTGGWAAYTAWPGGGGGAYPPAGGGGWYIAGGGG